jgi:hypothetical protein
MLGARLLQPPKVGVTTRYTDNRTAVFAAKQARPLDSGDAGDLTSARHDQTN